MAQALEGCSSSIDRLGKKEITTHISFESPHPKKESTKTM